MIGAPKIRERNVTYQLSYIDNILLETNGDIKYCGLKVELERTIKLTILSQKIHCKLLGMFVVK